MFGTIIANTAKARTLVIAAALLLTSAQVRANTITVNNSDDTPATDGNCTLREAIDNANDTSTGQPNTDCDAGDPSGADSIEFDSGVAFATFTLTTNTELEISSDVTIVGTGATQQQ